MDEVGVFDEDAEEDGGGRGSQTFTRDAKNEIIDLALPTLSEVDCGYSLNVHRIMASNKLHNCSDEIFALTKTPDAQFAWTSEPKSIMRALMSSLRGRYSSIAPVSSMDDGSDERV